MKSEIPPAFRKFFWDADFSALRFPQHENYILGKLMMYGDLEVIRWVLHTMGRGRVEAYFSKRGERCLDRRSYLFWEKVLRMDDVWRRG